MGHSALGHGNDRLLEDEAVFDALPVRCEDLVQAVPPVARGQRASGPPSPAVTRSPNPDFPLPSPCVMWRPAGRPAPSARLGRVQGRGERSGGGEWEGTGRGGGRHFEAGRRKEGDKGQRGSCFVNSGPGVRIPPSAPFLNSR